MAIDKDQRNYTCPACGYLMFSDPNDESEICLICSWQNNVVDLETLYTPAGPNHVSLFEAQKNFIKFGAIEERLQNNVRAPNKEDKRDPKWRSLEEGRDIPRKIDLESLDPKELYYWYWN